MLTEDQELTRELCRAIKSHSVDGVKAAIKDGVDVNRRMNSMIPIILAVRKDNQEEILQLLLDNGANIEATNTDGQTVLGISSQMGCFNNTKFLLDHGANVNSIDAFDSTPLSWAITSGSSEVVGLLIDYHANINAKDNQGNNIFQDAIRYGTPEIVHLLLKRGVKVDIEEMIKYAIDNDKPNQAAAIEQFLLDKKIANDNPISETISF